ncbi:Lrp/AsnC family transcriptional regulator [archaeon]|jgi:Lrp/AsnC family transcriptional regulator, leucine-responsive regulatory protein|nr:Lrp/AsnC family transcriptional regulator [archaeon]MBT6762632.1 Lrp/AsnC family transcriptional regulator [archaeon]
MKNIRQKLVTLFRKGYCTPQISRIAKQCKEASTTIHYNIKKLEELKIIKAYKAVFDYKKIDMGYCAYVLCQISPDEYTNPSKIAKSLVKHDRIESVDICTGDWELILKVRAKDQDEYYEFLQKSISQKGIVKIKTVSSLKQLKTEFIPV